MSIEIKNITNRVYNWIKPWDTKLINEKELSYYELNGFKAVVQIVKEEEDSALTKEMLQEQLAEETKRANDELAARKEAEKQLAAERKEKEELEKKLEWKLGKTEELTDEEKAAIEQEKLDKQAKKTNKK